MDSSIEITRCQVTGDTIFSGRITRKDLEDAHQEMDEMDRMVFSSEIKKPSDITQNLDLIFKCLDRVTERKNGA